MWPNFKLERTSASSSARLLAPAARLAEAAQLKTLGWQLTLARWIPSTLPNFGRLRSRLKSVMRFRCSRDTAGKPSLEALDKRYEALAFFLASEVGADTLFCDELLGSIQRVSSGESREIITGANAHTLTITESGVTLENTEAIPPILSRLPLREAQEAIDAWKCCFQP